MYHGEHWVMWWLEAVIWNQKAIISTNVDGFLLVGPSETNLNKILIQIFNFSFKTMQLKMPLTTWQPCASASMC